MANKYLLNKFSYNGYELFDYLTISDIICLEDTDYIDIYFEHYKNYQTSIVFSTDGQKIKYEPRKTFYYSNFNETDTLFSTKITTDFIENLPNNEDKKLAFFKKDILKKILSHDRYKHLTPSWMYKFKKRKLYCINDFETQSINLKNNEFLFIPIKLAMFLDLNKKSGCYIIKNIENNKYYIGQSTNINKRLRNHFDFDKPRNHIFLEDYYKSSIKNKDEIFKISFIFENDWNKINDLEKSLIKKFESIKKGYNTSEGGGSNFLEKKKNIKESQFIKKLQIIKNEILKLDYMEKIEKENGTDRESILNKAPTAADREFLSKTIVPISVKRNKLLNDLADEILKSNLLD